ncbi:MAG TPA: Lrp/AsnC family transcriptional regulator [Dermatophilaceae bacterium]|jgi:DNA-binding Lrp family transcriptional regulator|nr:Lrp/AsnC family transcriptional regulator [Dermatophilaceae bacterium]
MAERSVGSSEANGPFVTGRTQRPSSLDAVDLTMIGILERDGRVSVRQLAEQAHVSRANAYARLERLQRDGVITGFGARVDPRAKGLATSAVVTLQMEQQQWRGLQQALESIPEVVYVALVGGEFDAVLLVRARDNDHLREIILEGIQAIPGVTGTRTYLVFDELDRGR